MNLMGLTPSIVASMRRQFRRFLELWGADTAREFFLSTAINGHIHSGRSPIQVLHSPDAWFGVTHAKDQIRSQALLLERVASGVYPESLGEALAGGG